MNKLDTEIQSDPAFQQFVSSKDNFFQDFTILTKEIRQPVLIIAGKEYHAVGPHYHEYFQFQQSETALINGGHHLYAEEKDSLSMQLTLLWKICLIKA